MSVFKGICTALITPFIDGEIDYDAFGKIIDRQIDSGVNALLVCGTTGEACTLSAEEKMSLISFAVEKVNKRIPVIAGIGGNCTKSTATAARAAKSLDVDAILSVTPYYNKCTQEGLIKHYSEIASSTDLPIIVYNVPSRTGVNILPETMLKLCDIENVAGIKEAGTSIIQCAEMMAICKGKTDLYCGNDNMLLPELALGSKGGICVASNIVPDLMCELVNAFFDNRMSSATQLQLNLIPLIKALFCEVNPIPVKAAASLKGLCKNEVRLPLTPLSNKNIKLICDELDKLQNRKLA